HGDRPPRRPNGERAVRPADDRTSSEGRKESARPPRGEGKKSFAGDRPRASAGGKPVAAKPASGKPAAHRSSGPRAGKPAGSRPAEGKPGGRPGGGKPGNRPGGGKPPGKGPQGRGK
ncbi:pseudouridine synthase, partial [Sinorhizobium meliloti]